MSNVTKFVLVLVVVMVITTVFIITSYLDYHIDAVYLDGAITTGVVILSIVVFVIGMYSGLYTLAFMSKFFARSLTHDPDRDKKRLFLFVKVDKNRQVVIERSGNPLRIIEGGEHPRKNKIVTRNVRSPFFAKTLYTLFTRYESFIFAELGLYAYVPFFTKPKVYPLPRYRIKPMAGNNIYVPVEEDDKGYYSNHVRNKITTWHFKYEGVDIEGIPFIITGSLQYYIDPKKVILALYETDDWNVLLDQTSITVIRSIARDQSTVDKILGHTGKELWGENVSSDNFYEVLSRAVEKNLRSHVLHGEMKLEDVGIEVVDVLFNDFEPQISPEELTKLRSPILDRQVARGQDILGTAEAGNQKKLVAVHKDGGETSDRILAAEALVRASEGNKLFETLIAAFVQKNT